MEGLGRKRLRVTFSQDMESSLSLSRTYVVEEFKEPLDTVPDSVEQLIAAQEPWDSMEVALDPAAVDSVVGPPVGSLGSAAASSGTGSSGFTSIAAVESAASLVLPSGTSGGSGGSLSAASSSSIDLYGLRSGKRITKPILKYRESLEIEEEEPKVSIHKLKEAIALEFVKKGTQLLKWTRSAQGRKVKRFVRVTEDGSTLEIVSRFRVTKVELADVERVTFGPKSIAFSTFDWRTEDSWRCFSIRTSDRTWDFQLCAEQADNVALLWFLGLQSLSPMNQFYMTWGKILWTRAHLRAMKAANLRGVSVLVVWTNMARIAKNPRLRKSLWQSGAEL